MSFLNSLLSRFERIIDPYAPYDEAPPPDKLWPFFWRYLKQAWGLFLVLFILGLIFTLTEVAIFSYMSQVIDYLTHTQPADLWRAHGRDFVMMGLVLGIVWPLSGALHSLVLRQGLVNTFPGLIRWQTHRYVVRQSMAFFTNDFAGRVASKIVETASSLRNTLNTLCDSLLYVIVYFSSAVLLFAKADLRLIVPLVIWAVLYVGLCAFFVPRLGKASEAGAEARSVLAGRLVDTYTNIQTVKLFANTRHEDDYVKGGLQINIDKWRVQERLISGLDGLAGFLNAILILSTGALAIWLWTQGAVTIGAIALIAALTQRITNMSNWIMYQVMGLFENIGSVSNGMEMISRPHTVVDVPDAPALAVPRGEVRFEHAEFAYGELPALSGIDLTIAPGEKIGLVGPSGAGKSTLVNLFLRLYDLKSGRILIDGQDIATVNQESLRAHIGMVTQDTSLLHRSIRDNIAYGSNDATQAEIERAADQAHASGFIPNLEDGQGRHGYDAHVGERGV